jgi:hypothetical protein
MSGFVSVVLGMCASVTANSDRLSQDNMLSNSHDFVDTGEFHEAAEPKAARHAGLFVSHNCRLGYFSILNKVLAQIAFRRFRTQSTDENLRNHCQGVASWRRRGTGGRVMGRRGRRFVERDLRKDTVRFREGDALTQRVKEERFEEVVRKKINGIVSVMFDIREETLNARPTDVTDFG